jgi:hypothetical protein
MPGYFIRLLTNNIGLLPLLTDYIFAKVKEHHTP